MDRTRGKGTALTARQKKQQFREKKYKKDSLGTKKEGQGFADYKKKKAVYNYRKLLRKEEARSKHDQKEPKGLRYDAEEGSPGPSAKAKKKFSTLHKAEQSHKQKMAENAKLKKEIAERKKQQDAALEKYQEKKKSQYKLLCKKNFRGQPKVAGQMSILLSKIEASQKNG